MTDGDQATLPTPAVTGTASADYQAFVANGYKPVVAPLYAMVQSTSGVQTEESPLIALPNCVAQPATFDLATASASDLARYGLPALPAKGMTRAQYTQKFGWMKHRVCSVCVSNAPSNSAQAAPLPTWSGNIADQNTCSYSLKSMSGGNTGLGCDDGTPYVWTEADADWFMPCFSIYPGTPTSSMSGWVGVGGVQNSGYNQLAQAGVTVSAINDGASYTTWYEWASGTQNNGGQQISPVNITLGAGCGTHIYARMSQNSYTIGNIGTGVYGGPANTGPWPDDASAEFIVERNGVILGTLVGLANFGSIDFKGMGVTEQSLGYLSMTNAQHDYVRMFDQAEELTHVGSIVYDGSDYPYDDNTITWEASCYTNC